MEINTWLLMILLMKTKVTKKYLDAWDGIKNKIKAINGGKENEKIT